MIKRTDIENSIFRYTNRTIITTIFDDRTDYRDETVYTHRSLAYTFWLTVDNINNTIHIQYLPNMRSAVTLFNGTIDTKEEFNALMVQLGIK